jgi:small subunit ribosomal protein S27e
MSFMSKRNIMIPKPRSNFVSVQCNECGEKRVIFTYTTKDVDCKACGHALARKTGGKANINAKVLNILD